MGGNVTLMYILLAGFAFRVVFVAVASLLLSGDIVG